MGNCEHISELEKYLAENKLHIWSEHGEDGFVNIHCTTCKTTYEVVLPEIQAI